MSEQPFGFQEEKNRLEQMRDAMDNTFVRCALIGASGVGKSSLLNAIVGSEVAETDIVEKTMKAQEVVLGGVTFVDLPGVGTTKFPFSSYYERLNLSSCDAFILVTAGRLTGDEASLYARIRQEGKPCFVVRSKFDEAVASYARKGKSATDARIAVASNIREGLGDRKVDVHVYCVSSIHPLEYDLADLTDSISTSLPETKRVRFSEQVMAWTVQGLKEKRSAAMYLSRVRASLAAVNGALNPIPGVDIAVDVGILWNLVSTMKSLYKIDDVSLGALGKAHGLSVETLHLIRQAATKGLARVATENAVRIWLTREFGKRAAARILRWIPVVGQLLGGTFAYKTSMGFAEELVDTCEATYIDIISIMASQTQKKEAA